ncbi:hypothetical protein EMP_00265 [Thermotoga sp. EMP]|nr:hypothetical protein EMP_00265 [Thermotoga sp. EMP]
MANEWDFLYSHKNVEKDWDGYFQLIVEKDPYNHLRSIHNGGIFYDHTKPWITHASIQWQGSLMSWGGGDTGIRPITTWREKYKKPIVVDECGYEGDIPRRWGSLPAWEMVNRFWEGVTSGGYVTHGETYYSEDEVLWWSKGGKLKGESPTRIAFLRSIIEEAPFPLEPIDHRDPRYISSIRYNHCLAKDDEYILFYYDLYKPSEEEELKLPEGKKYKVELIDTWEMKITKLGVFSGKVQLKLPGKSFMALRIQKVE